MSTQTEIVAGSSVVVDIFTQSVNVQVTMLMRIGLHLAKEQGLSAAYLIRGREVIESGLYAWLTQQTLQTVCFEYFVPGSETAIRRFDVQLKYSSDPSMPVTPVDRAGISEFIQKLKALPPGSEYRILVKLEPGAVEVPGWAPSYFRPLECDETARLGSHGFGHIGGELEFHGRL